MRCIHEICSVTTYIKFWIKITTILTISKIQLTFIGGGNLSQALTGFSGCGDTNLS